MFVRNPHESRWSQLIAPLVAVNELTARTLRGVEPMAPNKRRLGATDLEITTVGFGAWAIGGDRWADAELRREGGSGGPLHAPIVVVP